MAQIRILLADDHTLVRAGIRALLERQPDMKVVGEAADGQEVLPMAQELSPDVVVMDIAMPKMGGLEATRRIKAELPQVKVLMLTMHENENYFFKSIHAGAQGFIVKGAMPKELLVAVRTVAQGEIYLYSALNTKLISDYLNQRHSNNGDQAAKKLTDREQQIVCMISEGRTGREIATTLGISPHTVERHRQNNMTKLGFRNRAELINYALRHGLLDPEI